MTTTILPDRPVERSSADQPVLVVVDLDRPGGTAPDPAVLAAGTDSPVELLVLAPRMGFSTDAALVAGAHRRVREEVERALPALRRLVPQLGGSAEVVWYARTPIGNPREQARRAARRVARRRHARAVILPSHLEA